ncbi:MAG: 5-formyltetrahydrofolate cyclo-ligase [Natrialbaceae archaeon]|nr:5-formyltetrahydrofolate cyclo-ligase [Natrialbaceae archaeon]
MDKQAIRKRVWDDLEERGIARFPYPPHGRIPNFEGAGEAADRLSDLEAWQDADVIKANPDAPQLPVRRAALRAGKLLDTAVPRLRDEDRLPRLDPAVIDDIDHATTIAGSSEVGEPVAPAEMESIDCIVAGSVAVTREGNRIGKGEGYSDLEFAILRAYNLVTDDTTTVTTVHERQIVDGHVPAASHDVPIDWISTPNETIATGATAKPDGIDWSALNEETIAAIPVLEQLR